ncbi:MAG TPA: hypothetical protein VMT20_03925 [Terriglobia bacterium]|nr:hypothetical protein [Terriglobia bacterium]
MSQKSGVVARNGETEIGIENQRANIAFDLDRTTSVSTTYLIDF